MATALAERGGASLVPAAMADRFEAIEKVVGECGLAAVIGLGAFQQAFQLSYGMRKLRELITDDMMKDVMALQSSPLGFITDKDTSGGYQVNVVKEVFIEATLRGFRMVGNEVNIIAGRFYGAKNGMKRKVAQHPGLTDLRTKIGVPKTVNGGAIVTVAATWKLRGQEQSFDEREIAIRVNSSMGVDAIVGKADRKLHAAILSQLTGREEPEGEADDDGIANMRRVDPAATAEGAPAAGSRSDALADKIGAKTDLAVDLTPRISRVNALVDQVDEIKPGRGMDSLREFVGDVEIDTLSAEQLDEAIGHLESVVSTLKPANGRAAGKSGAQQPAQGSII